MCIRDRAAVAEAVGEGGRVKSGRPRETQQQKLARIKRELEAVPTDPGVYPVSYTHLDVYKRQGHIRSLMAKKLSWRVAPELRFYVDTSVDQAEACLLYTSRCV